MEPSQLQKAIYDLLNTEPFYGHFILNSRIMYDAYNVPTAGVAVVSGVPLIIFNTKFLASLTQNETKGLIKHELLHLVLDHLTSTKEEGKDPYLSNIAQDCAINQHIIDLPKGSITVASLSQVVGKQLEPLQTSDYYYDKLMDKKKELEAAGTKTLDEHGVEVPGQDSPALAKAAVQRVAKEAAAKAAGIVPDFVMKTLGNDGLAKLPWKQLLRNFIMSRVDRATKNTVKKINRRFKLPVPGKKQKRTLVLGVCLDSSGSVSNEQYISFLNEVKSISKLVSKTWLVHADCEVQAVEELTPKTKLDYTRKGNGGTAYQPAITKCVELGCDVILYFGDFDTSDLPVNPRRPFLWIGVGEQKPPANFGKVIRL